MSDKSFDIKILSKSCPAETQPITLGLVVRKSQPVEHSKRYKLFKEQFFFRLYSTADVIFDNDLSVPSLSVLAQRMELVSVVSL